MQVAEVNMPDLREILYAKAEEAFQQGDYQKAYDEYLVISGFGGYRDTEEKMSKCREQLGLEPEDPLKDARAAYEAGEYEKAEAYFRVMGSIYNSEEAKEMRMLCLEKMGQ